MILAFISGFITGSVFTLTVVVLIRLLSDFHRKEQG
jgi:hypothetical protein